MVLCYCCHIYGNWKSKEMGKMFQTHHLGCQVTEGPAFMGVGWGGAGSHYIILILLNFSSSLTGYCKSLCVIPPSTMLAVLPILYLSIYIKLRASINVCIT